MVKVSIIGSESGNLGKIRLKRFMGPLKSCSCNFGLRDHRIESVDKLADPFNYSLHQHAQQFLQYATLLPKSILIKTVQPIFDLRFLSNFGFEEYA